MKTVPNKQGARREDNKKEKEKGNKWHRKQRDLIIALFSIDFQSLIFI